MRRLFLAGLAVLATTLPACVLGLSPAQAASPQPCPSHGTPKTNPCVINWTGNTFSPAAAGIPADWSVLFVNADSGLTKAGVTMSYVSGPKKFVAFKLQPGQSKVVLFAVPGKEVVRGKSDRLGNPTSNATITIAAPPSTPPPSSKPTTQPPATKPPAAKATHAPAPQQTSAPAAVTNPPPLGVGTVPTPAPSAPGPGPQVAAPDPVVPQPQPTIQADVPRALSQPVPARKYGLPGALAAVLLAGVAVGVVRAARSEFGDGHPQAGSDQPPQ